MSTTGPQYDGWEVLSDIEPTTTFHRTVTARMGVSVRNWSKMWDCVESPPLSREDKLHPVLRSGGTVLEKLEKQTFGTIFWAKAGIVYVLGLCPLLLCQQKTTCTPVGPYWKNVVQRVGQNSTNFWHNFWTKEKGG